MYIYIYIYIDLSAVNRPLLEEEVPSGAAVFLLETPSVVVLVLVVSVLVSIVLLVVLVLVFVLILQNSYLPYSAPL